MLNAQMTLKFGERPQIFNGNIHYSLVSLMWMKIGSNDITAQVPGVS
jgi:hypothetical protein